ncbi:MAG: VWA domain-containing protein [Nanoarchaeota archaeon]
MRFIRAAGLVALLAMAGCGSGTDETGIQDVYDVTPKVIRPLQPGKKSVSFIVDTSSSMSSRIDGVRKIEAAKQSLQLVLAQYNAHNQQFYDIQAGLFDFGGWARVHASCLLETLTIPLLPIK